MASDYAKNKYKSLKNSISSCERRIASGTFPSYLSADLVNYQSQLAALIQKNPDLEASQMGTDSNTKNYIEIKKEHIVLRKENKILKFNIVGQLEYSPANVAKLQEDLGAALQIVASAAKLENYTSAVEI